MEPRCHQNFLLIAFVLFMYGCSATPDKYTKDEFGNVITPRTKSAQSKGLRTGITEINVGTKNDFYFYEKEHETYFFSKDIFFHIYITGLTTKSPYNEYFKGSHDKLVKKNNFKWIKHITRSQLRNKIIETQRAYKVYSKKAQKLLWVTFPQRDKIVVEWADYKSIANKYRTAISRRDSSVIKLGYFKELKYFMDEFPLFWALTNSETIQEVEQLKIIARYLDKDDLVNYANEKITLIQYIHQYELANNANISYKKDFLSKYRNYSNLSTIKVAKGKCYAVTATKLNIRSEPSKRRYSKVEATYDAGDIACIKKIKGDWALTDLDGWIAKKYLNKIIAYEFNKYWRLMDTQLKQDTRTAALTSNSIPNLALYVKQNPEDKEATLKLKQLKRKAYENIRANVIDSQSIVNHEEFIIKYPNEQTVKLSLINLYRSKGSFPTALKAYELSKDSIDLKSAFKLAKSPEDTKQAERLLVNNAPLENLFELIEISSESESPNIINLAGDNIPIMQQISEVTAAIQTIEKTFQLKPKIKLQAAYKVTVNFEQELHYKWKSNLKGGLLGAIARMVTKIDKKDYQKTFTVSPTNNYTDTVKVPFKISAGTISTLGIQAGIEVVNAKINIQIVKANQLL